MRNSFTKHTGWLWHNAEEILIVLFFATFVFNIRKVFLTRYSFLNGTYNDFLTPSIRLSDIVIILFLFIYIIKYFISQVKGAGSKFYALKNVIQHLSRYIHNLTTFNISRATFFIIIFWLWICFSIAWASFETIALYKAIYISEILGFLIILYYFALNKAHLLKSIKLAVIISGTIQSLIAVLQFILNRSLGIKFLGESLIGPNIDGVAKITLFGMKHIRSYGTFPHPNILAGFLIIPIFFVIDILFRKIQMRLKNHRIVSHGTISRALGSETLLVIILFILTCGFILTFSRSAYIGLLIGLFLYFFKFLKSKRIYTKHLIVYGVLLLSVALFLIVSRVVPSSLLSDQSMKERGLYSEVSREIISMHSLQGAGIGEFVFAEYKLHETFQGWQYQPVHNLYLLITAEIGIIGIIIFLLFLTALLFRVHRSRKYERYLGLTSIYYCIIISFLIIAFFDHYFWDIEQGLIIFFIPFLMENIEEITSISG